MASCSSEFSSSKFTVFPKSLQANRSYADILRQGSAHAASVLPVKRISTRRSWRPRDGSITRCFRCGGGGHLARECREPIKCFRCGLNGHRRINCSSFIYDEPRISNRALAQSWISMIYQDDVSIRNSVYSRETMNIEERQFNLQYLELRKTLLSKERADNILLVRLLDGLFNSNFKASTIASLLLDEASVIPTRDSEKMGTEQIDVSITSSCFARSCSAELFGSNDVFLLDPCVDCCRNSNSIFRPTGEHIDQQLHHSVASPLTTNDIILGEVLSRVLVERACTDSPLFNEVRKDSQVAKIMPVKSTSLITYEDTGLVLFNSFELLDVCIEEDYPVKSLEYCSNLPVGVACLPRSLSEKSLCVEDLDSDGYGWNSACNDSGTTDVNKSGAVYDCAMDNYSLEKVVNCLNKAEEVPCEPCCNGVVALCSDSQYLVAAPMKLKNADREACVNETLHLEKVTATDLPTVLYCNAFIEKETGIDCSVCGLPDSLRACCSRGPELRISSDNLIRCEETLNSNIQAAASSYEVMSAPPDYPPSSPIVGDVEPDLVTPPSGSRRGRKKKGFYKSNFVRRSARLGRVFDRSVHTDGGVSESGVGSTSDSDTDG